MRTRRNEAAATRRRSQTQRSRWQATVTAKGRVTLPKPIRDRPLLRPGHRIDFIVEADGGLRIVAPAVSVTALKGVLPKPGDPVTLREMDEAIVTVVGRRSSSS